MIRTGASKNSGSRKPQLASKKQPGKSNSLADEAKVGSRILLVEDELLIAESMKEVIEDAGYKVVGIFPAAEDAILHIDELNPDLIVMDVRLRGSLDGIQAARIIQQTIKAIPILFLTAHTKLQFPHLDYLNPNSYRYLNKPYAPADVIDCIKKLLSHPNR